MEKNENKQFAVGLDIGTTKIVAMVSGKKEVTLAEKIAKMVYGKEVTLTFTYY